MKGNKSKISISMILEMLCLNFDLSYVKIIDDLKFGRYLYTSRTQWTFKQSVLGLFMLNYGTDTLNKKQIT